MEMELKYNTKTGWLCLDFANTVDWHASANPEETITEYADLIDWSKQVGIISAAEADILSDISKKKPAEAQVVLNKARVTREAIYNILSNISQGLGAKTDDLTIINKAVADIFSHSKLMPKDNGFTWDWDSKREKLDFILWPIVRSAAELMTSERLERVGQCADEQGCGWLFLDYSRNKSRRWCDMRDCGNRAKARRHYKKIKSEEK